MSSTFDGFFFFFQKDEEEEEEKSNQIIKDSVIEDVFRTFLYEYVCACYAHITHASMVKCGHLIFEAMSHKKPVFFVNCISKQRILDLVY